MAPPHGGTFEQITFSGSGSLSGTQVATNPNGTADTDAVEANVEHALALQLGP